eukprot:5458806-Prymnesium_polylepis.1
MIDVFLLFAPAGSERPPGPPFAPACALLLGTPDPLRTEFGAGRGRSRRNSSCGRVEARSRHSRRGSAAASNGSSGAEGSSGGDRAEPERGDDGWGVCGAAQHDRDRPAGSRTRHASLD